MKVGVPKEVKNHEYRVAITPVGRARAVRARARGLRREGGGRRLARSRTRSTSPPGQRSSTTADEVWADADMVLKVKEPVAEEYHRMREGQTLFTYLHLAANRAAAPRRCSTPESPASPTRPCSCRRAAAAALPDVRGRRLARAAGRRPLPDGARRRPRRPDGRRLRRVRRAKVVVIGAGVSGQNAAAIALGMRRDVRCSTATSTSCGRPTGSTRATCRPSRPTRTRSSRRCWRPTW